ncbi:unnamed protein product, partial [Polarella glacialis]
VRSMARPTALQGTLSALLVGQLGPIVIEHRLKLDTMQQGNLNTPRCSGTTPRSARSLLSSPDSVDSGRILGELDSTTGCSDAGESNHSSAGSGTVRRILAMSDGAGSHSGGGRRDADVESVSDASSAKVGDGRAHLFASRAFEEFPGVLRDATGGPQSTSLGSFLDESDAAVAFDAALRQAHSCRAVLLRSLNFCKDTDYFDDGTWDDEPVPAGRSSRFMGVSWMRQARKYNAKIGMKRLGLYSSEVHAARAYDRASLAQDGPTNFHPSNYPDAMDQGASISDLAQLSNGTEVLTQSGVTPPVAHKWIAERCKAQLEQRTESVAAAAVRAKLHLASDALTDASTKDLSVKHLWQQFLDADRKHSDGRQGMLVTGAFNLGIPSISGSGRQMAQKCEVKNAADLAGTVLHSSRYEIVPTFAAGDNHLSQVTSQLDGIMHAFVQKPASTDHWPMGSFAGNEAQSRMIINLLLFEVCKQNGLNLYPEEPLPRSAPVLGVADYVLRRGTQVVAVVEAKRCLPSCGHGTQNNAWASLLTGAIPQTLSLLAGFQPSAAASECTAELRPWGLITDARHWLLVDLPVQGLPVLQMWPGGAAAVTLAGSAELGFLFSCSGSCLRGKEMNSLRKIKMYQSQAGSIPRQLGPNA